MRRKTFTVGGKCISPEIFRDFGDGDLADSGSIWVTVDVQAAVVSNLYADPIKDDGRWVTQTKLAEKTINGQEETSYQLIGATADKLLILIATYNGGGSGTFYALHIFDVSAPLISFQRSVEHKNSETSDLYPPPKNLTPGIPNWTLSGFSTSWRTLRVRLERKGCIGPGLTLYGLRHTVAVILRESGADERTITDALGQKSIEMARHYAKGADLSRKMHGVVKNFDAEVARRRSKTVKPSD